MPERPGRCLTSEIQKVPELKSGQQSLQEWLQERGFTSVLDIRKSDVMDVLYFDGGDEWPPVDRETRVGEYKQLEELARGTSYFDWMYVRELSHFPCADWLVSQKRDLLAAEWVNLQKDGLLSEPVENLSDAEVEKLFQEYGERNYEYFAWMEGLDVAGFISRDDDTVGERYDINPESPERWDPEDVDIRERERRRRDFTVTLLSTDHGVMYGPAGNVHKLFFLDKKTEQAYADQHPRFGFLDGETAGTFLQLLNDGTPGRIVLVIYLRNELPRAEQEKIDALAGWDIPSALQSRFDGMANFESEIEPHAERIIESVGERAASVISHVNGLLADIVEKNNRADIGRFGHTLQRSEMSVFLDCLRDDVTYVNPQHTIARYAVFRRELPPAVVQEFEEKFNVRIPPTLAHVETFDEYLKLPLEDINEFFSLNKEHLPDMRRWLREKVERLIEEKREKILKPAGCTPEELVRAQILKKDVSDEEIRLLSQSYEEMISARMRFLFEKKFRVSLASLTAREQLWFLQFMRHQSADTVEQAVDFVQTFGVNGLRTFLSLEHDRENGHHILKIGEMLDKEDAAAVFAKYAEIAGSAEEVGTYMRRVLKTKDASDEDIANVANALLVRGKDLLADIAQGRFSDDMMERLNAVQADVLLFANIFRIAWEKGGLRFEDIEGAQLYHKDSLKLSSEEKASMIQTFVGNRRGNAGAYPKEWLEQRKREFSDLLDSQDKKFYLLSHDENIVAFLHLEPRDGGQSLYLGSVNVATEGRGKKIGGAFLHAVLEKEGRTQPMELIVNSKNAIAKSYQKDFGFDIIETIEDYHGSGQRYYRMRRPPGGAAPRERRKAA